MPDLTSRRINEREKLNIIKDTWKRVPTKPSKAPRWVGDPQKESEYRFSIGGDSVQMELDQIELTNKKYEICKLRKEMKKSEERIAALSVLKQQRYTVGKV